MGKNKTKEIFLKDSSTVRMINIIELQSNKDWELDQLSNFGKSMKNLTFLKVLPKRSICAQLQEVGRKFWVKLFTTMTSKEMILMTLELQVLISKMLVRFQE